MFALHLRAVSSAPKRHKHQSPWRSGWIRALLAALLALTLSLVSLPNATAEDTSSEAVPAAGAPEAPAAEEPKPDPEPSKEPAPDPTPDPAPSTTAPAAEPQPTTPAATPTDQPETQEPQASPPKAPQARTTKTDTAGADSSKPPAPKNALPLDLRLKQTGSYDRDYDWQISKQVVGDDSALVRPGANAGFDYKLVVKPSGPQDTNFRFKGIVQINNPNRFDVPVQVSLVPRVSGAVCEVENDGEGVVPEAFGDDWTTYGWLSISYECVLPDDKVSATSDITNVAVISWSRDALPGTDGWAQSFYDFNYGWYTPTVTDRTAVVTDTASEFASAYDLSARTLDATEILGRPDAADRQETFTYSRNLGSTVAAGQCQDFDNTATLAAPDGKPSLNGKGDDQKGSDLTSSASVSVCAGQDLVVTKSVASGLSRTYNWELDKQVDATRLAAGPDGKATFTYTVKATPLPYTDSLWTMTGSITVTNPNAWAVPAEVSDAPGFGDGVVCALTGGGSVTVPAKSSKVLDYTCTFSSQPSYDGGNTAVVTWNADVAASANDTARFTVPLTARDWKSETTNETITVVDDKTNPAAPVTLGTAVWNAEGTPTVFTYPLTLDGPVGDQECSAYTNTAVVSELPTLTDKVTVEVCGSGDVGITKTHSAVSGTGSVDPGEEFEYILTVTNLGSRPATNVVVTDPVPSRLEVTGLTLPAGWTNANAPALVGSGQTVSASVPTLALGASAELRVKVKVKPLDQASVGTASVSPLAQLENNQLANTACVAAAMDDNPENNCATDNLETRDIAAVASVQCVADAPYLTFSVNTTANLNNLPIQFSWTPVDGSGNAVAGAVPSDAGFSPVNRGQVYTLPWPGAHFGPGGVSDDWPGWRPIQASDYTADGTNFLMPGTTTPMTQAQRSTHLFNGLILDDRELDYSWRFGSKVTFSVNPEITFTVVYPDASADCFVARNSQVEITKTASVDETVPGGTFDYTLAVQNVSGAGAAESVVVTDPIPAVLKVNQVTTAASPSFPNWRTCQVTGQDAEGYGGLLTCTLFGLLQPGQSAPVITVGVEVDPSADATSVENVAAVDYHSFGNPSDTGHDEDDATVRLLLAVLPDKPKPGVAVLGAQDELAMTGSGGAVTLFGTALAALISGSLLLMMRRRRHDDPGEATE